MGFLSDIGGAILGGPAAMVGAALGGGNDFLTGTNPRGPDPRNMVDWQEMMDDPYTQEWLNNLVSSGKQVSNRAGILFNQGTTPYWQGRRMAQNYGPEQGLDLGMQGAGMLGGVDPYLSGFQAPQAFNLNSINTPGTFDPSSINTPQSLNPNAPLMGQGLLNQAMGYNPQAAAQDRFQQMEALMDPYRQRERERMDESLFLQGRLGSTGGGVQQQNFQDAIERSRQQNALNAISSSENTQNLLTQQGIGLARLGLGAQGQSFGQGLSNAQLQAGLQGQQYGQGLSNAQLQAALQGQGFSQGLQGQQFEAGLQQQGISNALQQAGMFGDLGMNIGSLGLGAFGAGMQGQLGAMQQRQGALNLMGIMPNIYQNLFTSGLGYNQGYNSPLMGAPVIPGSPGLFQSLLGGASSGIGLGLGSLIASSDRRLKTNIKKIGKFNSQLDLYSYTIDGKDQIGVMADEVLQVRPDAVGVREDGYLTVNYGVL